jgi:L-fucose isomerase
MDMNSDLPKAIWGFNGTERPGAVYLAATLAAHNQMGLPAFGIYGRDVQDLGDENIPDDVKERLLSFARAGLAVAIMRGRSYLSIGSVSMGIAGSMVTPSLFQEYFGMRNEYVDSSEILRRIEKEIYNEEEFNKALAWVKENCKEGEDLNPIEKQFSREQKDKDWAFVVKMTLIIRDLMIGNEHLKEKGFGEEAHGHNALVSGFQGQRQWTDFLPNGDFSEAILNSSFDWNGLRSPFIVATENDSLNGISMLFNYLLSNTPQIFAYVRT